MEGRAQPTEDATEAVDDHDHDHKHDHDRDHGHDPDQDQDHDHDEESLDPQLLIIKPNFPSKETYVVQMPRDQVYRVPPPEHAKIVENYKKHPTEQKGHKISCCCWVLVVLAILGFGIGIFLVVSNSLFRPKSPVFHVTSIRANNLMESNKTRSSPSFDFVLAVSNPNSGISASYKEGGKCSLIFKNVSIGGGDFPQLSQEEEKSSDVNLKLDGTKDGSSKDINTALNDNCPKPMILKIDVPIEMKNWIKSMNKNMKVTCNLSVKSFGKDKAEISSEDCKIDF